MQLIGFLKDGFDSTGSFVMWAILVLGVVILGLVIERFYYLFIKCGTGSGSFMAGISKYLKQGDYERAMKFSSSVNTPLARGVTAILQNRGKGQRSVQKAVDEVFLTEAPKVSKFLNIINTMANLATLLGLTGTIYGLMISFDALANVPAAQRANALAVGISVAMATTLFGLLVAVPTLLAHGILNSKAEKIVEEMDEKTAKLINLIEE